MKINFHRHQLPVVTALNTPLDIEHSSWRCVRSKVGRRLVRRCQEVYFFLSSLRDSPSTYTHRYETTQREVRKRWCGGLWKVIRKVSNFLTFHLQIGYLGLLMVLPHLCSLHFPIAIAQPLEMRMRVDPRER